MVAPVQQGDGDGGDGLREDQDELDPLTDGSPEERGDALPLLRCLDRFLTERLDREGRNLVAWNGDPVEHLHGCTSTNVAASWTSAPNGAGR